MKWVTTSWTHSIMNLGNWNYAAGIGNDPRENRKFNMIKQEP